MDNLKENLNDIIYELNKYKLLNNSFYGIDNEDLMLLFIIDANNGHDIKVVRKLTNLLTYFEIKILTSNIYKFKGILGGNND